MKKILFALCLLSVVSLYAFPALAQTIMIDAEHFPDETFCQFLHDYFNAQSVETDYVNTIDVSNRGIADLTGIEYFTKLMTLDCSGNRLFTLDLSRNVELIGIDASGQCPVVGYITLADGGVSYVVGKGLTGYDFLDGSYDAETGLVTYTSDPKAPLFNAGAGREGLYLSGTLVKGDELIPTDEAHFPDDVFRSYVGQFDADVDGMLCPEEIAGIKEIQLIDVPPIYDLTGIGYFTALEEFLCISQPDLETLDLSKNTALTTLFLGDLGLTSLDVSACENLKTLRFYGCDVDTLDLSSNTLLETVSCTELGLTSIDVSNCSSLKMLDCANNSLATVDLSDCTALESFLGGGNPFTTFDFSLCPELRIIDCSGSSLETLKLECGKLQELRCDGSGLTSLDVSGCPMLETLSCAGNALTELDVSANEALVCLYCNDNVLSTLTLPAAPEKLQILKIENNRLARIDLDGLPVSCSVSCSPQTVPVPYAEPDDETLVFVIEKGMPAEYFPEGMEYDAAKGLARCAIGMEAPRYEWPTGFNEQIMSVRLLPSEVEYIALTEKYFPDANFRAHIANRFDKDEDGLLSPAERAAVKLIFVNMMNVASLKGLEYFPALETLSCNDNPLTELDVSQNLLLTNISCYNTGLASIDVTKHTALQYLYVRDTKITALDVTKNTELKLLSCSNTKLSSLDVTKNTKLTELRAANCGLSALDLSNNENLKHLDVSFNSLSKLDLKACTALSILHYSGNQLGAVRVYSGDKLTTLSCTGAGVTSLNLDAYPSLRELNCSDNALSELDVSMNTELANLDCSNNELTALDLSKNTNLFHLICPDNAITSLDLENCPELQEVKCANNRLSELKFGYTKRFGELDCSYNELTELDLRNVTTMGTLDCSHNCLRGLLLNEEAPYNVLNYSDQKPDHLLPFWFDGETGHCLLTTVMKNAEFDDGVIYDETTGIASFDASRTGFSYRFKLRSDWTATLEVNILRGPDIPVSEIRLNRKTAVLLFSESMGGETVRLSATVLPEIAAYQEVTWSSGDESVATVTADGVVTAVSRGITAITCTAADGSGVKATCAVTVVCEHEIAPVPANEPTCTESGNYAYYTCRVCEQCFKDEDGTVETTVEAETIPANGHRMTLIPAVAATCTEAGSNAYYNCIVCRKYFKDEAGSTETTPEAEIVSAKGHSMTYVPAKEPACAETGNYAYYACSGCAKYFKDEAGDTETTLEAETIPANGHRMTPVAAKEPTCTETGNRSYYHCSACAKYFKDEAGDDETTLKAETILAKGHSMTHVPAKAPACAETGNYAYYACSGCAKYFKDEAGDTETTPEAETIPANGHSMMPVEAKDATCTEAGNRSYYHCSACTKYFKDEAGATVTTPEEEIVPAKGHMPVDRAIIPATRQTKGYGGKVCERCYIIFGIDKELPILKDVALLTLPSYVKQIGEEAFAGSAIECVILPDVCTRIEGAAFANCAALKLVEMTANVEWIAEDAFRDSPLAAIVAPAGSYAEGWAKEHHIPVATE